MKRFLIDHELFIPIGVGLLSIFGIALIGLVFILGSPKANAPSEPTNTPFKYLFLGDESPATASEPSAEDNVETPTEEVVSLKQSAITATQTQPNPGRAKPSATESSSETAPAITTASATATLSAPQATSAATFDPSVFTAGKYNDFDDRIFYDGFWVGDIVDGAFEEDVSISTLIGDTAEFRFAGTQLKIGYPADTALGAMNITIDGVGYTLNQSSGNEWTSLKIAFGEHAVTLSHQSGETVILDYIIILE
ncbi:MAG: hypothetical protein IT314_16420 [Anaerolineales bacterium]|nr:hypothetical protein [Anaerolineales bacterium]